MTKNTDKKLVLVGTSALAEIAYEYFTYDSDFEVVAFSANREFVKEHSKFGLPVLPFEDLENHLDPKKHTAFVAVAYSEFNRARARLFLQVKAKGFSTTSYISSKAFVWRNAEIGENCFIFENNVVQPFVKIADNVVLWSGNHIGHHSKIGENCFISSHVVICGFVNIGSSCFLGVNSSICNNIEIGADNWIGPGVVVTKTTQPGEFHRPLASKKDEKRTSFDVAGFLESQ